MEEIYDETETIEGFPILNFKNGVVCDLPGCCENAVCHDSIIFLCREHAKERKKEEAA